MTTPRQKECRGIDAEANQAPARARRVFTSPAGARVCNQSGRTSMGL
jgi:hypothetical protein